MGKIQFKRGTNAEFQGVTLSAGEPGFVTTTGKLFVGNGTTNICINPTLGSAALASIGTNVGELPAVGADGKLPEEVIPITKVTNIYTVATEADLVTLTQAKMGDFAVTEDTSSLYILATEPPTEASNWNKLAVSVGVVKVNGKQGTEVVVGAEDIPNTGYQIATQSAPIEPTDTVAQAFGKVAFALQDITTEISGGSFSN
ncbi:MAG: hypothetical protein HUJ68_01960 [Clostridia bacterium]|nr:hypothetical protein [Clostridia bacterium]